MLGFVNDVGTPSRLIMATQGRWTPEGDVSQQLHGKLSECVWWVLVLADGLDIDMDEAFGQTMDRIERHLEQATGQLTCPRPARAEQSPRARPIPLRPT
jgi:hypothetical protein